MDTFFPNFRNYDLGILGKSYDFYDKMVKFMTKL